MRSQIPGTDVLLLLGCERINRDTLSRQKDLSYAVIDDLGCLIYVNRQSLGIIRNIHRRLGLKGKAHIHDLDRMSVSGREIYQPAFCDDADSITVLKLITDYVIAKFRLLDAVVIKIFNADFAVEMSGIAAYRAVFHGIEMSLDDYILASRNSYKEITQRSNLIHCHYLIAFHNGFTRLNGIDLGDDYLGA